MTEQKLVKTHSLTVKVREKCLEAGFTTAYQLQVAAGIAPSVAQHLFNENFSEISLATLEKLLEALNCTAADLFVKEKSELQKAKEILCDARRVLILTGAGVSAESNVPTFRGGGSAGVWRGMSFEQLSSAQMVEENLPLVWEWFDYRRKIVGECEPNAAHTALSDWQRAGDFEEFTLVTQNIDGLHRRAGSSKILELHGNIWRARCRMCGETFDVRDLPADERPPVCKMCGDFLRPNVVLFGENLPVKILETAVERAKSCDVCLVIGTSSLVYPAASLPEIARQAGAKIIEINPEPTALTDSADVAIRGKASKILPQLSISIIGDLNDSEKYVTQTEAARLKEVSRQRIGQLVKSGRLKTIGEGHDALISVEDLMNLTEGTRGRPRKLKELQPKSDITAEKSSAETEELLSEDEFRWNIKLISNEKLTEDDVPSSLDDWENFALTYKLDELRSNQFSSGELYEIAVKMFKQTIDISSSSLDELRAVLFVVQRQKRMSESEPDNAGLEFIQKLFDEIRSRIKNKISPDAKGSNKNLRGDDEFVRDADDEASLSIARAEVAEEDEEPDRIQSENDKELVLDLAAEGGGADIYRQKSKNGAWTFLVEVSNVDDDDFYYEPSENVVRTVESIGEAMKLVMDDYQIFIFTPLFLHAEHRAEVKAYLENLLASLNDDEHSRLRKFAEDSAITPEDWIARADEEMKHRAEREAFEHETNENDLQRKEIAPLRELSNKHFLIYWQERIIYGHARSDLDVVASRQLERANAGDTLWLVTINRAGRFVLVGRLKIGEIVDYQTAIKRLNYTNLWDSGFFALAKETEAEDLRRIILVDRALALRFAGSESDRFVLENGKINPQQLQTMPELTADSAEMLARIWQADKELYDADLHNVEYFRQLVREDPLNAGLHYKLGFHCNLKGLTEESNAAYRKAIELAPECLIVYEELGQNYLRAGELDKAREVLEDAILLAPKSASLRFMLGLVYAEVRDYEKAISVTKQGFEYDSNDAAAYFNVGTFYFHLQNYEKAVRWLEKSAEIDESDNPKTFYRLGKCYRHLGKKQKEFDAYRKAVEKDPDFLDALFALGTVYAHLTESTEGEQVNYFEPGKWFLSDPRISFYLGLGNLALDNIDDARVSVIDLRKMDAALAEQLQFFVDRRTSVDESQSDEESENKNLNFSDKKRFVVSNRNF